MIQGICAQPLYTYVNKTILIEDTKRALINFNALYENTTRHCVCTCNCGSFELASVGSHGLGSWFTLWWHGSNDLKDHLHPCWSFCYLSCGYTQGNMQILHGRQNGHEGRHGQYVIAVKKSRDQTRDFFFIYTTPEYD